MLKSLTLIITILFSFALFAQPNAVRVKMGATALTVNNQNLLALSFSNEKKWHTYWKNPGDAGTEIKPAFYLNDEKIELKEFPWPTPQRYIEQGDMWAYGYEQKYALFYALPIELKNKTLEIKTEWLVCKDICIPEGKNITLKLNSNLNGSVEAQLSVAELSEAFRKLPYEGEAKIDMFLTKGEKENQLALHYMIEDADFDQVDPKSSIVYPYLKFPFDYKHEEVYFDRKNKIIYGRFYVDWDGIYEEPILELPADGKFAKPIQAKFQVTYPKTARATIITQTFTDFSLTGDKTLSELFNQLETPLSKKPISPQKPAFSLWTILLFGFLGGLILNLMPCVLPVISLKLFGLIVHSDEKRSAILKHNLAYTAGVLFSFLVLGAVIIAIKSSGAKIGWGFQLQSPLFVFVMLLVILVMAMNMLGLFEFVTPGGRTLGNKEIKKGLSGDFINGILATILSTPCSAPFLGTALTYAFTTSTINIFIVFISIGTGLSFPFILTGFFPALIQFLPKPGAWMEKLKNLLGLSLLLTAVWLYDVFAGLVDMELAGIYINTLIIMLFFAFYFRKNISKKWLWNALFFAIPFGLFIQSWNLNLFDVAQSQSEGMVKTTGALNWKRWTQADFDASKQLTFVNFTAKWCLTCKVNKKLVLNSDGFSKLVEKYQISLMEGDWTKRDETITDFLGRYNIVGVPAYFIKKPDGSIISLGETISLDKIEKQLK